MFLFRFVIWGEGAGYVRAYGQDIQAVEIWT